MSILYDKYDVAISLCKQDVDFAKKNSCSIESAIRIVFYEDKQDDYCCLFDLNHNPFRGLKYSLQAAH